MEDDKYIEFLEEEKTDVKKMATWKKVLIAITGVVVAFMIVIYVAIDFIARDIGGDLGVLGEQSVTESEEDSVPIKKVKRILAEEGKEQDSIWESQWEALGERQQYLAFGTHLSRNENEGYKYSREFVDTFYMIADGWFSGASDNDLQFILLLALEQLPDTAVGKEVYDKLISITQNYKQEVMVMKGGESPYEVITRENSPYVSDRCGYKVGQVETFSNGVTATYQGKDVWIATDGVTWWARALGEGRIQIGLPEWF